MNKQLIQLELIWWILTAVIVGVVMFPILKDYSIFPFKGMNILYIVCTVTFARYAFLLKYTFLAHFEKLKIGFVLFTAFIVFILVGQIQDFNIWMDQGDPDQIMYTVKTARRESLLSYIKSEYVLFAVGSVVAAIFLAGRLLWSVWRLRNRGKV
jgi:hypothetical protein